jgi:hypothetical protein
VFFAEWGMLAQVAAIPLVFPLGKIWEYHFRIERVGGDWDQPGDTMDDSIIPRSRLIAMAPAREA